MLVASSFPRSVLVLTVLGLLAFLTLLIAGPLSEATLVDRLFSSTLLCGTAILFVFATRRLAFSLILTTILFGLIFISSILKFTYLTTPLLAPDLVYFLNRDLLGLLLHYPVLLGTAIALLIVIPTALYFAWRYDYPAFLSRFSHPSKTLVQIVGVFSSIAVLGASATPEGPFSAVFEKGMWVTMIDKSYISDFVTSFYQTQIVVPPYSNTVDSTISWEEETLNKSLDCLTSNPCKPPTKNIRYPDIVTVLQESTFDPRILEVCTLPICKRKMFLPDARTKANGYLKVHTWGGGTWTAEFALLTGQNHLSFGNAGLYAPYNLAPRINYSLPQNLKAVGYRTVALYPTSGDFINARNAYKNYGFDAFYDGSEYGLVWESSDNDLIQVFDRIYEKEKKISGDKPLFIFMLTLHQHGPHMKPLNTLPEPFNHPLFPTLDNWLNLNLGNYLSRLAESDQAITYLEKKLLISDQPTILLHFGDHQPSFDGAINNLEKIVPVTAKDSRYVTYYMLKTNFKIPKKYDYPILDISFLGGLLMEIADVPKDKFFQANSLMRERCQGIYFDCKQEKVLDSYHDYIFHQIVALHE